MTNRWESDMEIVRGHRPETPAERRGPTFTGVVYADPILSSPDAGLTSVLFTPGARTFWHYHERGQILVVLGGAGFVCTEDGEPQPLSAGDIVWAPPGERHWHGGGPDTFLSHLAISLGTTV